MSLVPLERSSPGSKDLPRKNVKVTVEEEEFNKGLTSIIRRDFFPDLVKFETGGDFNEVKNIEQEATTVNVEADESLLCLDQFLNKYESEDDTAFTELLVKSKEIHDQKHAWLHDKEQEYSKSISVESKPSLPGVERQSGVKSWTYTAKNSLMYVPDGIESSAVESVQGASRKREIIHCNTRLPPNFQSQHHLHIEYSKKPIQEKVGVDGKVLSVEESPKINGYGFLSTPQIQPGVEASPLMTWGSIEGTPMRMDSDGEPPTTGGPSFKMPKVPAREKVALRLMDQVAKATRERKKKAMASPAVVRDRIGTPSKLDRLQLLSPAARRLVSARHSDKALAVSYTPRCSTSLHSTPTHKAPSITDNLLNIKRGT